MRKNKMTVIDWEFSARVMSAPPAKGLATRVFFLGGKSDPHQFRPVMLVPEDAVSRGILLHPGFLHALMIAHSDPAAEFHGSSAFSSMMNDRI
jgi:hypothetical protein